MSEEETPQASAPQDQPESPAASPEPAPAPAGPESGNRTLMIVLSYLWILFLVPLLAEKEDQEVQWHAKNGLVLTILEILIQVVLNIITATGIGCVFAIFIPFVFVAFAVIRLIAIIKGINGERWTLPGMAQYVEKF